MPSTGFWLREMWRTCEQHRINTWTTSNWPWRPLSGLGRNPLIDISESAEWHNKDRDVPSGRRWSWSCGCQGKLCYFGWEREQVRSDHLPPSIAIFPAHYPLSLAKELARGEGLELKRVWGILLAYCEFVTGMIAFDPFGGGGAIMFWPVSAAEREIACFFCSGECWVHFSILDCVLIVL